MYGTMWNKPGIARLGYVAMVVALVVGLVLASLAVGAQAGPGRIVWLGIGVLLGGLWALRSHLPVLSASDRRIAVVGWLGLLAVSLATVAVAPTSLRAPSSAGASATTDQNQGTALRPALPTAVRRTGTVGPTPGSPTPVGPAGSTASASQPPAPGSGSSPTPAQPVVAAQPAGFDPQQYLGRGNAYDCRDLGSQAEAQAILRADPTDPNVIDNDQDGIACETNPPPRDTRRVPR